eukprot:m51a1_g9842 putative neurobeachin-like protein 2 (2168) ;mRNA; r:1946877-1954862
MDGDAEAVASPEDQFLGLLRSLEAASPSQSQSAGPANPSPEILSFLFDLLGDLQEDGGDDVQEGAGARLDFLGVFFGALAGASPELRAEQLRRLNLQLRGAGMRLEMQLSRRQGVARLLDLVAQGLPAAVAGEVMRLLQVLMGFNTSVADVKRLLAMLSPPNADERPWFWTQLLGIVRSVAPKEGPECFWNFNGHSSGMALPPVKLGANGYAVSLWLRVESQGADKYSTPHVLALLADDASGVELLLRGPALVLRTSAGKSKSESATFARPALQTRRWYHLVLAHTYHLLRRSDAVLYVDGRRADSAPLLYPRCDAVAARNTLCCAPTAALGEPLCAQVGAVAVFLDALDDAEAAALYARGPNAAPVDGGGTAVQFGKRAVKVAVAVDPRARRGPDTFYDVSAGSGAIDRYARVTRAGGVGVFSAVPLDRALVAAGGVKLLLPLFRLLDLPAASPPDGADARPQSPQQPQQQQQQQQQDQQGDDAEAPEPAASQSLADLITLITQVISRDKKRHLEDMATCGFFSLMSHALSLLSPAVWTKRTAVALDELFAACSGHAQASDEMFREVYLNFRLWAQTRTAVQHHVVGALLAHARDRPEYFRTALGVEGVADVLRAYYWGDRADCSEDRWPGIARDDVALARQALLRLVGVVVGRRPAPEELRALACALHACGDDEQCVGVVQFLLTLVDGESDAVWAALLRLGGAEAFLTLLRRRSAELRQWSCKLVCHCIRAGWRLPGAVPRDRVSSWLAGLKCLLQQYPVKRAAYNALAELMLDCLTVSCAAASPAATAGRDHAIRFPEVLPPLLELLGVAGPPWLRCAAVADLVFLVSQRAENRDAVVSLPCWPTALLRLAASDPRSQELQALVVGCFAVLLHHTMQRDGGYDAVRAAYAAASSACDSAGTSADDARAAAETCAMISLSTIGMVEKDAALMARAQSSLAVLSNIVRWHTLACALALSPVAGAVASDALFLDVGARTRPDGTWADARLAQQLLELGERLAAMLNAPGPASEQRPPLPDDSAELRVALTVRLTAHVLRETWAMVLGNRGEAARKDVAALDALAARVFARPSRSADGIARYLRVKAREYSDDIASAERALAACVKRLSGAVEAEFERPGGDPQGVAAFVVATARELLACAAPSDQQSELQQRAAAALRALMEQTWRRAALSAADPNVLVHRMAADAALLRCFRDALGRTRAGIDAEVAARAADDISAQESSCIAAEDAQRALVAFDQRRRAARADEAEARAAARARAWRQFVESSAAGRRPAQHWKLDQHCESALRMRRRLKPNPHFDPHRDLVPTTREELLSDAAAPTAALAGVAGVACTDGGDGQGEGAAEAEAPEDLVDERGPSPAPTSASPAGAAGGAARERVLFATDECELVEPMTATPGTLDLTAQRLRFVARRGARGMIECVRANESCREVAVDVRAIASFLPRRYVHLDTALEVFTRDRLAYFLRLPTRALRDRLYRRLEAATGTAPPVDVAGVVAGAAAMVTRRGFGAPTPETTLRRRGLTEAWVARRIGNFEYLMALNTVAGRSYNDLSQYPVFPWVVADYASERLDLAAPATFRDLSKPMGALTAAKEREVRARYEALGRDAGMPAFHHGTHYMTLGAVLHYLIRLEPFTGHFLEFQGGRFDHPNRMFTSPRASYAGAAIDASCTKELIPEFYYLPEFLRNANRFDFGLPVGAPARPDDATGLVPPGAGDVELPPWAQGSPETFVRVLREALESDWVSERLCAWIDLVFGYKQRGKAAEEALNVFYYLCYDGTVNVDALDADQRASVLSQIYNFGQVPAQLFRKPHPRRPTAIEAEARAALGSVVPLALPAQGYALVTPANALRDVCRVGAVGRDLVALASDGCLLVGTFAAAPDAKGLPFTFDIDRGPDAQGQAAQHPRWYDTPPVAGVRPAVAVALAGDQRALYACGAWDGRVQVRTWGGRAAKPGSAPAAAAAAATAAVADDVATCAACDAGFLAVGTRDCTVVIVRDGALQQRLFAHSGPLRCVAASEDFDALVSASGGSEPVCALHSLRTGLLVRSLALPAAADCVALTPSGDVVWAAGRWLGAETLNGTPLGRCDVGGAAAMAVDDEGTLVATCRGREVSVHSLPDIRPLLRFEAATEVLSLTFAGGRKFVLAGTCDGALVAFQVMARGALVDQSSGAY